MSVRASACATLFWRDGQLIWDSWLDRRQHALTESSEQLLRWFSSWRPVESARDLGEEHDVIALRLLEAGVLVARGSERHLDEERLLARWERWGASARQFHFASRTGPATGYRTQAQDVVMSTELASLEPIPPLTASNPELPQVSLPDGLAMAERWPRRDLLSALAHRRSVRSFAATAIGLEDLAALLELAGGSCNATEAGLPPQGVYKRSPSAGALPPYELYVVARAVDGLGAGVYHYAPSEGCLERIADTPTRVAQLVALGGQEWLVDAPALLVHTAVVERPQWRYRTARAYRDLLIGLGHVSQTTLLAATAMGLGAVLATAVRDENLEAIVHCDGIEEIVLGTTAVGWPAADGAT